MDLKLGIKIKKELLGFLRANQDVFAWTHSDMCRIPPDVIVHKLNINSNLTPVKQKRRIRGPERSMALKEEVDR